MAKLWQHPFVNIFKIFGIGEWKKCSKEGDVTTLMEKTLKCTVYRIAGAVPAGNYIQFPRTSSQSLGLTGNFFYLLFKPIPTKHFVVHLDVATDDGLVIRISFSNLFKEFKSTSTWLQFPFISNPSAGSVEEVTSKSVSRKDLGVPSNSTRWTLLCLDLHYILSIYLNRTYGYLKSMRLCANMLIKNAFTSSTCYEPGLDMKTARKQGLLAGGYIPLPREMSFPVQHGENWFTKYDHIKFPTDSRKPFLANVFPGKAAVDHRICFASPGVLTSPAMIFQGKEQSNTSKAHKVLDKEIKSKVELTEQLIQETKKKKFSHKPLPEIGAHAAIDLTRGEPAVHIHANLNKEVQIKSKVKQEVQQQPKKRVQTLDEEVKTKSIAKATETKVHPKNHSLLPDPIMALKKIIGFGGVANKALWTKDGKEIVYVCHSVIVSIDVSTGKQSFYIGHTDKVTGLSFNEMTTLLASIQAGEEAILRIWKVSTKRCLVVLQTHLKEASCLSFSKGGGRLCAVGVDGHERQVVMVWNASTVDRGGRISIVAKAHTDIDITSIKFAPFDESRLVSCGKDSIRFWKVKQGLLRSVSMDLGQYQHAELTDIAFEVLNRLTEDPTDIKLYATSKFGNLLVANYKKMSLERVIQLLPFGSKQIIQKKNGFPVTTESSISLNCLSVTDAFCAIGSNDGFLRLWPFDFTRPFIEAEHEGGLAAVSISPDGTRVLGATKTGTLGILNVAAKSYLTLMRSHNNQITSLGFDSIRQHIATVSTDESIRVWNINPVNQLYDFRAPSEKPSVIACHPTKECVACGFTNGYVRIFDVTSTNLRAEHNFHRGHIIGVLFSPNGNFLYSAGSKGCIAVYDATSEDFSLIRVCADTVAHDLEATHPAIAVNDAGKRLACIGPTEFMVTVVNAKTLDELLRIDITSMARNAPKSAVDFAVAVCYSPDFIGHLLVATSSSRLIKLDANTGHLLSEITHIHRGLITAISVSSNGKYLATAGDRLIKIWDYRLNLDINFQVFIGHCAPINHLMFTEDGSKVLSAGEALFVWDFVGDKKKHVQHQQDATVQNSKQSQGFLPVPVKASSYVTADDISAYNYVPRQVIPVPERYDHITTASDKENVTVLSSCEEESETESSITTHKVLEEQEGSQKDQYISENCLLHSPLPLAKEPHEHTPTTPMKSISYHLLPTASVHYKERAVNSQLAMKRFVAPPHQAGLKLHSVLGYNGNGRGNMIWHPDTGLFVYTVGCNLIIEDLSTNQQKQLRYHTEEISTLGAQHDGQVLASAAVAAPKAELAQICIWEVATGLCRKVLEYHKGAVQSLQYSRDDRFLLSVGNYQDCTVAIWSARDYTIVSSSFTRQPIHNIQWDPFTVNEFATVGQNGSLLFWLLDETKKKIALHVHEADVPNELIVEDTDVVFDFTCLAYSGNSVLFVGSSQGVLSAWDTRMNSCFMHWEAGTQEICILVVKMGRLVTGNVSGCLQLWSLESIADLREPVENADNSLRINKLVVDDEMKLDGAFTSAVFDEALEMGILGTESGTLWYVSWESRTSVRLISGHKGQITGLEFFPDQDRFFATSGTDGTLRVWSSETYEQTLQFLVLEQRCTCLAFRPCHESVAATYKTGLQTFSSRANSASSSLKPRQCVAGYGDGSVRMFDLEKVEMVLRMKPHVSSVTVIAFSVDGCVIISGSQDGLLAVSSPTTGITMRILQAQKGAPITCIDVSKHETPCHALMSPLLWLAASGDRRVSIWSSDWSKDFCELVDWLTFPAPNFDPDGNLQSKHDKDWFSRFPPSLAQFSPTDADIVVYTGYGVQKQISFYSLAKKQVVRSIRLSDWALAMDIAPDASLIAVGGKDRIVKLIDYSEGVFQDFAGHSDSVRRLRFAPSGKFLYSVGYNDISAWSVTL